jgi:hypothetical protein
MNNARRIPADVMCDQTGIGTNPNSGDRFSIDSIHDAESQYHEFGIADEIIDDDKDIVFKMRGAEPLLAGVDTATVQCIKVEGPVDFNCWGKPRKRLVFIFKVIEPNTYAGTKLKMFVEYNPAWPYIPRSAKLHKLVQMIGMKMVVGGELRFNHMFRHKIFNCRLKQVGGRTIISNLIDKVVG